MFQYLALTSPGIEVLLAEEAKSFGATKVIQKPEGVYFEGDLALGYKISLWTRFATRVLLKIGQGEATTKEQLIHSAQQVPWSELFNPQQTFAIDFVGKSEEIRNTQFGALTVKDAVVDHFMALHDSRPSVDKTHPDIRFQARLLRQEIVFYVDFSGRSLFQRGYREHTGAAPLKENLAAAMVKRSGWLDDTTKPLVDPMCGSGTVLIEAIAMAAKQAPGVHRRVWGFEHWLGHDENLWLETLEQAKKESEENLANYSGKVYGSDLDSRVLSTAKQNARNAGFGAFVEFSVSDVNKLNNAFSTPGVLLFNPPYGERIGELPELVESFALLGQKLKQQYQHWRIAILTANVELLGMLKLATTKRYKFKNGPLDCQFALYDMNDRQTERDSLTGNIDFSDKPSDFANRLKKNLKTLKGWIKSESINCYRCYDADIPEYNVAVDVYGDYLVIHEYAPPKSIDADKATKRLQEVIYWAPKVLSIETSKVVLKTRAKQKGTSQYQRVDKKNQSIEVTEHGAKFKVNLWDYLDTGLFLDHRKTRQIVAKKSKGKSLLNLFAYTGSVSVQAALHGASHITTVDMSKTYLQWAEENFALNKLVSHKYQFVQANCLQWLKEHDGKYDLVFIDPPTFSNSKRMEDTFDVQRDHVVMLKDALKVLNDGGEIIFTNNKRNFKMDIEAMSELGLKVECLTDVTRDKDFARNKHIHNSWSLKKKNN